MYLNMIGGVSGFYLFVFFQVIYIFFFSCDCKKWIKWLDFSIKVLVMMVLVIDCFLDNFGYYLF